MTTSTLPPVSAAPPRSRRTRTALVLGGIAVVAALLFLGIAPMPVAVAATGLLLALLAGPGGHLRPSRRNLALAAGMGAGCTLLALEPVLTSVLAALPSVAFAGLMVFTLALVALPMALV